MIDESCCPVCGSGRLDVLRVCDYVSSGTPGGGPSTYADERLLVLFEHLVAGEDRFESRIVRCLGCGFIFSNPRLTRAETGIKYAELGKIPGLWKRAEADPPSRTSERAERIYRSLAAALLAEPRGLRVLDFGGAEGFNLVPFSRENDCFVIDYVERPTPEGVVYAGSGLSDLAPGARFEIILLCHVLEHVSDPVEVLREVAGRLAAGGLLYVGVPLGAFREWRVLKEPLTHVNFFSEQSLAACIERAGARALDVETAYEWVTHRRMWCVNAIVSGGREGAPVRTKSTRHQMASPVPCVRLAADRLRRGGRGRGAG